MQQVTTRVASRKMYGGSVVKMLLLIVSLTVNFCLRL